MDEKYEKIMDLPRPISENRAKMPRIRRAAQFAPFAALSGYDRVLAESTRQTQPEIFPDEGEVAAIDSRLRWIKDNLNKNPAVKMKVFCPDGRKSGGSFSQIRGKVVKIDEYSRKLWLETGISVHFCRIIQLFVEEDEGADRELSGDFTSEAGGD